MKNRVLFICLFVFIFICTTGCMSVENSTDEGSGNSDMSSIPDLPDKIRKDKDGIPLINVYVKDTGNIETMDLETYLMGVVAGEMKNDWPIEALKAQAILARTYTLKFLETKDSKYDGADISTDVTEAQAYNAEGINDNIKRAIEETRGRIMVYGNELPHVWFHAHSGGMTELPSIALEYKEDPEYLSVTASPDSEKAPDDVKEWTAEFTKKEIIAACRKCGVSVTEINSIKSGTIGDSGRTATLSINGNEISAPSFRIALGADKLKSTLFDSIEINGDSIVFKGRGYGHGVGMSQWGAYALAEKGATAQTIINRYFSGVKFADLWE